MLRKILAIAAITLILLATFTSIPFSSLRVANAADGIFTGTIYDYGLDTDLDGLFNYLVVDVQISVSEEGYYHVRIDELRDIYNNYLYLSSSNETYLGVGTWNVSLSFYGIAIYSAKFNPAKIPGLTITHDTQYNSYIGNYLLSKIYDYTLFDTGATFTGAIYDEGIDTDMDGLFNYLQVGVEINVSDTAFYEVYVSGLINASYYYIYDVYDYTEDYLSPGIHVLNVSLNGAPIYASHATNISMINSISLYIYEGYGYDQIEYRFNLNLTNLYNYSEFETLAYFTGTVYDKGVNTDLDPKYDYLEISVEINFTEAGNYNVELESLLDDAFNYLSIYQSVKAHFDVGVQLVNLTVYGAYIYTQHFNPRYIGIMRVYSGELGLVLDKLSNVPLPTLYDYVNFESHAFLTGNISDNGVDADGDGLFDYLEIGVEVNVTEAGRYELSASALMEKVDSDYNYLYIYQSMWADFDVGVHTVHFNCEGPRLVYEHFSPTNVSEIRLYESTYPYVQLGYIPDASLSKKYNYTLFDAPLKDMQLKFIVYPDGTTGVSGACNFTHMYPQNTVLQMNTTMSISTAAETTRGKVNGTAIIPEDETYGWPFNSTTAAFAAQYENGLLNASLDATVFMPPEGKTTYPTNASDFSLNSTYSNGLLTIELGGTTEVPLFETMFPLNLSDFTVVADYMGKELKGNITFHALPGFPIGDVVIHFNGNQTNLYLTGHINMTYGNFFGVDINSTILDEMLANFTIDIPGPTGLVYNMTGGLLECTQWETTKTPWPNATEETGADVQYNVTINGNFTGFFAKLLTQMLLGGSPEQEQFVFAVMDSAFSSVENGTLLLIYYHTSGIVTANLQLVCDVEALWSKALELVPSTVPEEIKTQVTAWLRIANATACAIQDFSLNASYSKTEQKLNLNTWLLANATQLKSDIIQILPDALLSPLKEVVESYLNTTYCTLTSYNATCTYVNGTANFDINWILQGDFKAQMNHTKRFYIEYLNATAPMMLNWQLRMLNETEIDVSNFSAEYDMGKDWMHITFDGLIIQPPKDEIDFPVFKLYKFFNMTSEDPREPPRDFEKLKIVIAGGFNGTHAILLYAPGTVPTPDTASLDYKNMTWQNVTMSSLRDLHFRRAYQKVIDYLETTYYVPIFTNSTVSNFNFNPSARSMSFNVSGTTGTGFSEITIPKALLNAALANWTVKIDGNTLAPENFTATENAEYVFIRLNYSYSEHSIEIIGTWIVPEFQPNILPLILTMLSLIAVIIAIKQRKKLGTITTRYQNAIHAFANKLNQLVT